MPQMEPMKVIIKQREMEYQPDYPDGWKFSAGDPFKFPVLMGDAKCFIKRFEQKGPEDISGWDLLVKLTGKYEQNLSRIYDIKNVQEDEKEIYYIFYEYLDGITLDKYIQQPDINLIHLNNDLFNAMRTLQRYEFWFADFFEKNIFCQKDGSFVLVDVDSTQRISDLPDNDMYGSKDYWILVLKYYKEVLRKNDLRLSDINGISLNYLQIPFLVLRLKMFINGGSQDYNSTVLFNQLPPQLQQMAPEIKEFFLKVIDNGREPLSADDITALETLVEKKIIKGDIVNAAPEVPVSLPLVKAFTATAREIESGGSFTLGWVVENTNRLELYKNGAMFKSLDSTQTSISLTGFADGTRQESLYQLYAYKDLALAKSERITIRLKDGEAVPVITGTKGQDGGGGSRRWLVIGAVGLAVILGLIFFLKRPDPTPRGNGKNSTDEGADSIAKPNASAGGSQTIMLPNNSVLLKGESDVPQEVKPRYRWSCVSSPDNSFIIEDSAARSTNVKNLKLGSYMFKFEVTVGKSITGSDLVQVNVNAPTGNIAPTANAGEGRTIRTKLIPVEAALAGSGFDPDANGRELKYTWSQTVGPTAAEIVSPFSPSTTVRQLGFGSYEFQLTVTDADGGTASNVARVIVTRPYVIKWPVEVQPGVFKNTEIRTRALPQ
jgi:hypothetical protein